MIDKTKIPKHVALICDGNRRWAKGHNLPSFEGHRKGSEAIKKLYSVAWELGIHTMTLWAFSTENWERAKDEIEYLMKLFTNAVDESLSLAIKHQARFIHIGRKDRIGAELLKKITNAENETKHFTDRFIVIALDYGGKDEVVRAIQKYQQQTTKESAFDQKLFEQCLDSKDLPYPKPDLIIRTGGEQRTSGFMIWQTCYSELMPINQFLPDLTPEIFKECIENFQSRQRRFGK